MKTPYDIIIKPIVTEKSNYLTEEGKYTFEVHRNANKVEIKKDVEKIFDVEVDKVRTLKVRGKLRRMGKNQGYTRSWKKAIVSLKPGSKDIQIYEGI